MKSSHYLLVFIVICAIGCGSSRSSLTGIVTLDGQPLDNGTLQLIPDDRNTLKQPTGAVISNGKYSIPVDPGLPVGIYTVRISSPEPRSLPPGFSINNPGSLPPPQTEPVNRIPAEWNTASTHTVEIKKGRNLYDFNILSK
jgi:hypothetical protein